ncbi:hypothetical protein HPB48_019861 [Haemaphysalis longicornis]|uniref:Uncharacterized protein n=1 Tax=Haemaphysalis longicornis TaxID=44386 RepID=A0A9J6G016_HAELO|nr:hypothetical protein HPB48_019861 [Haemaphysalis longicornis]
MYFCKRKEFKANITARCENVRHPEAKCFAFVLNRQKTTLRIMSGLDFTPVVNAVVESHANELWEISRFLCENPELALEETKAHDKLCEFLVRRGFTVQRQHLLTTAFRAEFRAPGGSDGKHT